MEPCSGLKVPGVVTRKNKVVWYFGVLVCSTYCVCCSMSTPSASQWRGPVSRWNRVSHCQPWWIYQILADIHRRRAGQAEVSNEDIFKWTMIYPLIYFYTLSSKFNVRRSFVCSCCFLYFSPSLPSLPDVFTNCGLTEDVPSPAFFSATTTRGRTQSQWTRLHTRLSAFRTLWHAYIHLRLLLFES